MNRSQARWLLVPAGVLLWFMAVLPAYYVVHKPIVGFPASTPPTNSPDAQRIASTIVSLLADLGLLALTLTVAAAWGSRIGRWLGLDFESGLERWTLGTTLGLGLLGSVVFGLGVAGGLYAGVGYAVLALLLVGGLPEVRALGRWIFTSLRQARLRPIPWLWLYVGFTGLVALGLALLPPTGWDALVYHLQGPRLYLEAHRLTAIPANFYLNWPAQVEMLFTWGMLLKGDTLAKLLHWVFWPLTATLLYILTRRSVSPRAGRWAVALWASVPFAAQLAGLAYVDLGLTAFVLACVYTFLRWAESPSDGWLAFSALLAGLAIAAKYTAATWLGLLLLLLVYHAWRHHRQSMGWIGIRAAGFALIAALVVVPWLAKNWIVTGNPIFPFALGGTGWNPTREAWLTWPGHGYSDNPLDYLVLPWTMTVLGTSGTAAFDATVGPLLLFLVPLALFFRRRPQAVNYALILVAGQFLYFAAMLYRYIYLAQTRLFLPAIPLLCLAGAYAVYRLPAWDRSSLRLSWVVGAVAALVLAVTLLTEVHAFLAFHPLAPLVGLESREGFLARRLGAYYEVTCYLNEQLPAGTKPIFLWEPRGYYSRHTTLADATLDNLAQLRLAYSNAQAALAALDADGFTHLLLYRSGLEFIQLPTPRPPTLGSLLGNPPPEESLYPLTDEDLMFLEELLSLCQGTVGTSAHYEICEFR